jgi:hypothetical protein
MIFWLFHIASLFNQLSLEVELTAAAAASFFECMQLLQM